MADVFLYPVLTPSEEWLRRAAVVFDRVRIFSHPTAPPLPDRVAELDAALGGVILRTEVDVVSWRQAGQLFEAIARDPSLVDDTPEQMLMVYDWKVAKVLTHELGLAKRRPPADHRGYVVRVNRRLFDLYVALLAHHEYDCAAITPHRELAGAAIGAETVAFETLPALVPDISTAEVSQIAELRQSTQTARARFLSEINKLVQEHEAAVGGTNPLDTLVKIARETHSAYEAQTRAARLERVARPLTVAFAPGSMFVGLAYLTGLGLFNAAGLAAAVAGWSMTQIMERRSERAKAIASPWALVTAANTAL